MGESKPPNHRWNADRSCYLVCFLIYFTFISLCLFHLNPYILSLTELTLVFALFGQAFCSLCRLLHPLFCALCTLLPMHNPCAFPVTANSFLLSFFPMPPSFYFLAMIFHNFNKIFYLLQYPNYGGLNRNAPLRLEYLRAWTLGSVCNLRGIKRCVLVGGCVTKRGIWSFRSPNQVQ